MCDQRVVLPVGSTTIVIHGGLERMRSMFIGVDTFFRRKTVSADLVVIKTIAPSQVLVMPEGQPFTGTIRITVLKDVLLPAVKILTDDSGCQIADHAWQINIVEHVLPAVRIRSIDAIDQLL